MVRILLGCAAFTLALPSLSSAAAQQPTAASATPAEAAARAVLRAINGDDSDRAALVRTGFTAGALENESAAVRKAWFDKLAGASGGLTIVSLATPNPRMVEAVVKSNKGGAFGKLVLFTSTAEPDKISDLFLLSARDPARVKTEAWPTGALTLPAIAAEIEKRVAALESEDAFSGVVLVAKGDRVLVRRAAGFADQQWRVPNRADTAFHTASAGKMFTAAAIMRLAGQGKLGLDDRLAKWVPEYAHPQAAQITLRHLLSHSAGIGPWEGHAAKQPQTAARAAATMTEPHAFAPGSHFQYSNAGFVLLGAVIEKATGKPLDAALQELVFAPAGMKRTGLWPVTAIVPNRATGYLRAADDPLGLGPRFSNPQFLGFSGDGSGGAYSTADDMFAFLAAVADGHLLGPERTKEMLTPRLDFGGLPRPSKYGYGVELGTCAGKPMFGHEGGGMNSGVSSLAFRTLESGWTVIVLSNYDPPIAGDLAMSICEFVAAR